MLDCLNEKQLALGDQLVLPTVSDEGFEKSSPIAQSEESEVSQPESEESIQDTPSSGVVRGVNQQPGTEV